MFANTLVIWMAAGAIAIVGLTFVLVESRHQKQRLIIGVQMLQAGRVLLVHLQQHRGVIAAYLAGISEPVGNAIELRRKVQANMAAMAELDSWLAENENWLGITRHWARLSARCETMPFDISFDQHCRLNASLLELICDAAEHYHLERQSRFVGAIDQWRRLLLLGELVGQCRALGMELIARDPALTSPGQYEQRKILKNINRINILIHAPDSSDRLPAKAMQATEHFIAVIQEKLLEESEAISAKSYFAQASEVIELVYEKFDGEMRELHKRYC